MRSLLCPLWKRGWLRRAGCFSPVNLFELEYSKKYSIPVSVINEFAERNLGVYENLTKEEIKVKCPDLYLRVCTRHLDDAPTDGETLRQFNKRITDALDNLKKEYPTNKILLVCHAGVFMIINKYYKGLSFDEMYNVSLGNCEMAEYTIKE